MWLWYESLPTNRLPKLHSLGLIYRKNPKVTGPVTFGFSRLKGLLL